MTGLIDSGICSVFPSPPQAAASARVATGCSGTLTQPMPRRSLVADRRSAQMTHAWTGLLRLLLDVRRVIAAAVDELIGLTVFGAAAVGVVIGFVMLCCRLPWEIAIK